MWRFGGPTLSCSTTTNLLSDCATRGHTSFVGLARGLAIQMCWRASASCLMLSGDTLGHPGCQRPLSSLPGAVSSPLFPLHNCTQARWPLGAWVLTCCH